MKTLFLAQKNHILSKLDAGHSALSITSTTGIHASTIFRLRSKECSELQKSTNRHLSKLPLANIRHAVYLITTQRAKNAVQVTKTLKNVINQPLSPSKVRLHLKKTGIKAVVKKEHPLLSAKHLKSRLDFAYAHKIGLWRTGRELYCMV